MVFFAKSPLAMPVPPLAQSGLGRPTQAVGRVPATPAKPASDAYLGTRKGGAKPRREPWAPRLAPAMSLLLLSGSVGATDISKVGTPAAAGNGTNGVMPPLGPGAQTIPLANMTANMTATAPQPPMAQPPPPWRPGGFETFRAYPPAHKAVWRRESRKKIRKLPQGLQALHSGWRWRMVEASTGKELTTKGVPVHLRYSFQTINAKENPDGAFSSVLRPIGEGVARQQIRDYLADLARHVGVYFEENFDPLFDSANILFRYGDHPMNRITGEKYAGYAIRSNSERAVITLWENYTLRADGGHLLAHELFHALGLSHPFNGSATNVTLPQNPSPGSGQWKDHAPSTVMTYTPGCYDTDRGALDMALLLYLYGPGNSYRGHDRYVIGGNNGTLAIADPSGQDRLVVRYPGTVWVTLKNGPTDVTQVGASRVLIAPRTAIEEADLSDTAGGWCIGNKGDNFLRGSPSDDIIDGGGGRDTVVSGAGRDVLLVGGQQVRLAVLDFDPRYDRIEIADAAMKHGDLQFRNTSGDSGGGLEITLPGSRVILLQGLNGQAFDPAKSVVFQKREVSRSVDEIFPCAAGGTRRSARARFWVYFLESFSSTVLLEVGIYAAFRHLKVRKKSKSTAPGARRPHLAEV